MTDQNQEPKYALKCHVCPDTYSYFYKESQQPYRCSDCLVELIPPRLPSKIQERGLKYDQGKPDFTYVSRELLEGIARVREFGAKKYSRDNWKRGFKFQRSLAAALRHIYAFVRGEDNDPESGLNHLYHAVCCLEHCIYDYVHHPENDDRYKEEK